MSMTEQDAQPRTDVHSTLLTVPGVLSIGVGGKRVSREVLYRMAEGGDLLDGKLEWVWNVASKPDGKIRDLRFWTREIIAPTMTAAKFSVDGVSDAVALERRDAVINSLLPRERKNFPSGEVVQLLLITWPTLAELKAELGAQGSFFPRAGLVKFFQRRWSGCLRTATGAQNTKQKETTV